MSNWEKLATSETIKKAIKSLSKNGIEAEYAKTGSDAKKRVLALLPRGAEVMNMTSATLDTIGVSQEIDESGNYDAIRPKLLAMDRAKQRVEMLKLGAAAEWAVGSVHAVTTDGRVLIASNTGSQLGSYAYASANIIWVVGAQKIVSNLDEAMARIYEYVLPKESERAQKAYGAAGSYVSKLLIVNREIVPGRVRIIFVGEKLGF